MTDQTKHLRVVPVTFKAACAFVKSLHRHNKPPQGHKFSVGLMLEENLIGVAMAGRPVARHFDDGFTLEVNRTCTDGTRNANSMLYGAVWRAAKAMGYTRCITYTQADETGASLRGAGWTLVRTIEARKSWADSSGAENPMKKKRDPVGNGGVARVLWQVKADQTKGHSPRTQETKQVTIEETVEDVSSLFEQERTKSAQDTRRAVLTLY